MGASSSVRADAIPGGAVLRTIVVRRFRDTPRYRIGSFVRFAVIWAFPHLEGRPGRTRRCSRPGGHSGFSRQDAQVGRPAAERGRYGERGEYNGGPWTIDRKSTRLNSSHVK